MSYDTPGDALLQNIEIIRKALAFYNSRLTTTMEREEIRANNLMREDLFEYLSTSRHILSDLKPESDFNKWFKRATHTLSINEGLVIFTLSSYERHLENSKGFAFQSMNYEDLEHPAVKFVAVDDQIQRAQNAIKYIKSRYY